MKRTTLALSILALSILAPSACDDPSHVDLPGEDRFSLKNYQWGLQTRSPACCTFGVEAITYNETRGVVASGVRVRFIGAVLDRADTVFATSDHNGKVFIAWRTAYPSGMAVTTACPDTRAADCERHEFAFQ